jgi:hypothetical protein
VWTSDEGFATYRECLSAFDGPAPVDFLMLASGDLGNAGFAKTVVELCGPAFVPEVHRQRRIADMTTYMAQALVQPLHSLTGLAR